MMPCPPWTTLTKMFSLLLEATKFDEANVSHDVLKIENQSEGLEETVMFKL